MSTNDIRTIIEGGKARLGVEFGSTRIKAVLIDPAGNPIAQGDHEWENQLVNNIWTYDLKDVWIGLQDCYARMAADARERYGAEIVKLDAIGISTTKANAIYMLIAFLLSTLVFARKELDF